MAPPVRRPGKKSSAAHRCALDGAQWWFIVPWIATIIDALTAGWLGINNAAQKPFFGKQGTN